MTRFPFHAALAAAAGAACAAPALAAGGGEAPSFLWAAVKMVFALGLVLGLLLGLSHVMKKYMDRFSGQGAAGRAMVVSDARRIGPKAQVLVLEALGSRYLLSVTPTQVSLLDKIPAEGPGRGAQ